MSWQTNIFQCTVFVMMSEWLFSPNQNLNVYDTLFMPVLFLFSVCINRYHNAKQLQFCVMDTDVEQYGGFQKICCCQNNITPIILHNSFSEVQTTASAKNNQCLGGCNCTTKNISHLQILQQIHTYTYLTKIQTNSKHQNFVRISEFWGTSFDKFNSVHIVRPNCT